jgi:tripartite-type tricarboxylate transporter receptor subunit TctC
MFRLLSIATAAALIVSAGAQAQTRPADAFPARAMRIVVGNAPGGGTDTVARLVAVQLTDRWKSPVVVENRSGATGRIAMEEVKNAAPDGYSILLGSNALVISRALKKIDFDPLKVYEPIVQMTTQSYLLVAHPSVPANNVKELVAYLKSRPPGTLNHGTAGNGSMAHLGMSLFDVLAGTQVTHIPYKGGGPAMTDLLSGRTQVLLGPSVSVISHVRSGKLKLLAVTSDKRLSSMPDLPAVAETLPGHELSNTYGLYAPAKTPVAVINAINRETNQIIRNPAFIEKLTADGVEAAPPNTPAQYRQTIEREVQRWEKFFKTPGLDIKAFG